MSFPTPSEYQEALQHPEAAFADEELKRAAPRTGPLGLPRPVTGAFAAVFRMTTPEGTTYAAKCFLSETEDQQGRYRAIADHLAESGLPYTVGFDYQPEGLRLQGDAFPVLKMEWVEGLPLNQYVEARLDDPSSLRALADEWRRLLEELEEAKVAHGDLQHGNVLVEDDDRPVLKLVDYDTMFVPALDGRESAEVGHRNYQHPDRTEDDFGPYLDRFPGLSVYVALRVLARRPGLWQQYDTGENLLFRASDFYEPGSSPLFAELSDMADVRREVEALRAACHQAPEDVPSVQDVRSGLAEIAVPPDGQHAARRSPRREARKGRARWFAPALAAAVGLALVLLVSSQFWAALFILGGAAAAGAAVGVRGYRRQPVVRRHRRLQQEAARFSERIETLRREERALQEQRRDVLSRREERRDERLEELRDEALRDRLKHHFIGEVRAVEGLSHKTVVRLKAANIRTAYEATPEALAEVRKLGEESTERLRVWRASLVERYADELPEALSLAQERRLARFTERRLEQIDAEVARTRRKVEAQAAERADVEARAAALPDLSFTRYLGYLLRLERSLPAPEEAPHPPSPAPPAGEKKGAPASSKASTPAESTSGPWYESST